VDDTCAPAEAQQGSAVSAVQAWSSAGIPVNQLVLGVPSYGHSFAVTPENAFDSGTSGSLKLYAAFDASEHPAGDAWDDEAGIDPCGVQQDQGGNWDFWGLIEAGYLDGEGKNVTEFPFKFDTCSKTVSKTLPTELQLTKSIPGICL
jgi:chitinase